MENEKQLIAKIRENRQILIDDVKNQSKELLNEIWRQIAKDCTLESAEVAKTKWKQMVDDYLQFLRNRNTFPHAHAMRFLQQHLISFKQSSSDDLTPNEFEQLRLLFESNDGATEKQSNEDVQDSPTSIIAKHSESTLPVPELVPAPISTNVEREQNMNVVTPSKDHFVIKTPMGPVRVVLFPKSSTDNGQQQQVAVIPSSGGQSLDNSQSTTTQPCRQAAVVHDTAPLQLQQQEPMDVPSSPAPTTFKRYAKTLQKMPPALRMQTKRKISEIIDEAELQLFE